MIVTKKIKIIKNKKKWLIVPIKYICTVLFSKQGTKAKQKYNAYTLWAVVCDNTYKYKILWIKSKNTDNNNNNNKKNF